MGDSRIAGIGNGMLAQGSGIDVVKRQEEAAEVMFADMISMNGITDTDNFATDVSDEMLSTVESHELDTRSESRKMPMKSTSTKIKQFVLKQVIANRKR